MTKKVKRGRPFKSKNLKETTPHKIEPTLTEEEIVRNTVIKAFAIDPEPIPETSKSNESKARLSIEKEYEMATTKIEKTKKIEVEAIRDVTDIPKEDKWFYCPVCKDCFLVNQRNSHKH